MDNWNDGNLKWYRDNMFFLMWFGCRPYDGSQYKITKSTIEYKHRKVRTGEKDIEMIIAKDNLFEAFAFLNEMESGYEALLSKHAKYEKEKLTKHYKAVLKELKHRESYDSESYCWRSTCLTQLLRSNKTLVDVKHLAGHATFDMLNDIYASKFIKKSKPWKDVMPIYKKETGKEGWYGYLIEVLMAYHWPCLLDRERPCDKKYKELEKILKGSSKEEREMF
jgi:hypothetical protein